MFTELQKRIYNEHLKSSRLAKNQPYRLRKDFTKLSDSTKINLIKLENLFISNRYIKIEDFFIAPYEIYGKEENFDLKFYASQKAVGIYSIYIKKIMESDPDVILNRIVDGIKFIKKFCTDEKISVNQYVEHQTGLYPTFILHLKQFIYPLYIIFYLPKGEEIFRKIPLDERIFLFSDNVYENISELNRKIKKSVNANRLLQTWVNKQINNNNTTI
jgi:hypothetical protein